MEVFRRLLGYAMLGVLYLLAIGGVWMGMTFLVVKWVKWCWFA